MNKKEFENVVELLKKNGFEIRRKYSYDSEQEFRKVIPTDDPDIIMIIYGDIDYRIQEKDEE